MCGSLKYLARFSAITSGEMDEIRARIVSVAEIRGVNATVDRIEAVERLIGIVLESKSGTARSVDLINDASVLFGLSERFDDDDDDDGGNAGVDCVSLPSSLSISSFNGTTDFTSVVSDLLLLFDGNLEKI